jgi:hypothetical protein
MRLLAVGTVLAGLLTGCNITDQYQQDVDDVGKQIVADWKELPEVTAAEYEYRHGLDQGQVIYVDATLRAGSISETVTGRLMEIARRDYWKGTPWTVSIHAAIHSSDNPPVAGRRSFDKAIHSGAVEIDFSDQAVVAELEQKYGPRPARK